MKTITHVIFLFFASLLTTFSHAQDASEDLRINRSVLKYYNGNDITDLQSFAPDMYELISNYFIGSYSVSSIQCEECLVDMNEFYNIDLFNIVQLESSREQTNEVSFVFKGKYEVILMSIDNLALLLVGNSVDEILTLRASRPLPNLINTGNLQNDFKVYQDELERWITDFPNEYRTITQGSALIRISISEFSDLSELRKEAVLTHVEGYIITE